MSAVADVVIAGGGPAAAATAVRLRALGFAVRLLVRPLALANGLEAVPAPVHGLLSVLGEPDLLAEAGGVEVTGPTLDMVHVDRAALARTFLDRAVRRGAVVEVVPRLPPATGLAPPAVATVDATGRSAAWSRPVLVEGHDVAWQFEGPPTADRALRVVHGEGWWAYRLGDRSTTWAAVVRTDGVATSEVLGRLGLDPAEMVFRGRRPARVQRATDPVVGRRIAVGDAALAHDPIAGGGIRFALASAVAAATTIATWADDPGRTDLASGYYTELVIGEHCRHLGFRHIIHAGSEPPAPAGRGADPTVVRFTGGIVETGLVVNGAVWPGGAVRLPDGTLSRWLGSFDLLVLARLAAEPVPRLVLLARLQEGGIEPAAARAALSWATRHGVLA